MSTVMPHPLWMLTLLTKQDTAYHFIHIKIGCVHSISHLWTFLNFLSSFLILPPQSPLSLYVSYCLTCCLAWCVIISLSRVWCEPDLKWLVSVNKLVYWYVNCDTSSFVGVDSFDKTRYCFSPHLHQNRFCPFYLISLDISELPLLTPSPLSLWILKSSIFPSSHLSPCLPPVV